MKAIVLLAHGGVIEVLAEIVKVLKTSTYVTLYDAADVVQGTYETSDVAKVELF